MLEGNQRFPRLHARLYGDPEPPGGLVLVPCCPSLQDILPEEPKSAHNFFLQVSLHFHAALHSHGRSRSAAFWKRTFRRGCSGVDEKQKWTLIFWHTVPKSCVFQTCLVGRSPEEDLDWNPAHDMVVNTKTPWSGYCCCSFSAFFHQFLPVGQETVSFDGRTWPNLSSFCLRTLSLVTRVNKKGGHRTRSALWVVLAISTRHLAYRVCAPVDGRACDQFSTCRFCASVFLAQFVSKLHPRPLPVLAGEGMNVPSPALLFAVRLIKYGGESAQRQVTCLHYRMFSRH